MRTPAVSKRSLTASVLPASGPGPAGPRLDPCDERVVRVVVHGTTRDALDLDLRAVDREARHLDERRRGSRRAEDLLPHRVDERAVVDVGEEDRHLDDVLEATASRFEHDAHVLEHLSRLRDDVVASDEPAVAVDRDDPGDVQEASRTDTVREVRDRLGEPVDADLLASHAAPSRSSLSLTRGLIRSGIDGQLEHRRLPGSERTLERGLEVLRSLDPLAVRSVGARERGEVRVLEVGADDAPGELPLLVHADRRVHAVVHEQDDDRQLVLHRGRELRRAHDEVAVTREADDDRAPGGSAVRRPRPGARNPSTRCAGTPASRTA